MKYKVKYITQGLFSGTRELEREVEITEESQWAYEKYGAKNAIFRELMNYHRTSANDIIEFEEVN